VYLLNNLDRDIIECQSATEIPTPLRVRAHWHDDAHTVLRFTCSGLQGEPKGAFLIRLDDLLAEINRLKGKER